MRIEFARAPSRRGLPGAFRRQGFALAGHAIVRQRFADFLREYAAKIGLRGLSSLQALGEETLRRGLARLEQYCHAHDTGAAVFEDIDLFVFRVPQGGSGPASAPAVDECAHLPRRLSHRPDVRVGAATRKGAPGWQCPKQRQGPLWWRRPAPVPVSEREVS